MQNDLLDRMLLQLIEMNAKLDNYATKADLTSTKNEIITTIDRFAKLHEILDQKLVATRGCYDRLEERLQIVETKLSQVK